ncbi:hypothetical protein SAMN06265375_101425 [Muriicola jejuensis]|nr:hypothetical protein SAMN06265375_101425 [Muriicola jejuensis]
MYVILTLFFIESIQIFYILAILKYNQRHDLAPHQQLHQP